jgi:hypothetical protein
VLLPAVTTKLIPCVKRHAAFWTVNTTGWLWHWLSYMLSWYLENMDTVFRVHPKFPCKLQRNSCHRIGFSVQGWIRNIST